MIFKRNFRRIFRMTLRMTLRIAFKTGKFKRVFKDNFEGILRVTLWGHQEGFKETLGGLQRRLGGWRGT